MSSNTPEAIAASLTNTREDAARLIELLSEENDMPQFTHETRTALEEAMRTALQPILAMRPDDFTPEQFAATLAALTAKIARETTNDDARRD
jgi:hypothetical protein